MSFFYGFADELVKVAVSEALGDYATPMAASGLGGAVIGGLTGKKGKRFSDALLFALFGAGLGAGREYWYRRKDKGKI